MHNIQKLRLKYAIMVVWGKNTGSNQGYIDQQLVKAEAAGAPFNAIYERGGNWRLLSECNEDNRKGYQLGIANQALKLIHEAQL